MLRTTVCKAGALATKAVPNLARSIAKATGRTINLQDKAGGGVIISASPQGDEGFPHQLILLSYRGRYASQRPGLGTQLIA